MNNNIDMLTRLAKEIEAIKTVLQDLGRNKLTKTDSDIGELKNKTDAIMDSLSSLENQIMPVSVQNEAVMQMVKSKGNELDARVSELLNGSLAREYGSKVDSIVMDKVEKALGSLKSVVEEAKRSTRDEVSKTTSSLSKDVNFLKSKKTEWNGDEMAKALEGKLSLTAVKDFGKVIQNISDQVSSQVANSVSAPMTVDVYNAGTLVKSGVTKINAPGATYLNGVVTIPSGGGGAVSSVFSRTGAVVSANGDYTASQVTNVPAGNIAAVTVQAALNELDVEKAGLTIANTFTAANDFTGGTITVPTPTLGAQSTPKSYVDNLLAGLGWKNPVRAMSTANIVIATPGATIGGVTMAVNDRFALSGQTTASENGLYIFNGPAVPATRSTDADTGAELVNASFYVSEGTSADTQWTVTTDAPITIGVTSITMAIFATGGATNLSLGAITATNVPINSSTGTGITTLPAATSLLAGIVTNGAQTFGGVKTIPSFKTTDSTFFIQDDGDATKQVQFQASGITTATTRTLTVPDADLTITGTATTQTLTNKRITKRVSATATNAATYALNTDNFDVFHITAQTATITSITTTGTPVDGDTLRISITGTAAVPFTLAAANFEASTISLPTTTVTTARLDLGFFWNTETGKFRLIAQA